MPDDDLIPESTTDAGVAQPAVDIAGVEPAHLLANDARERLQADGFDDTQIDDWAAAYVDEVGSSVTVEEFVTWIARREGR